MKVKLTDIVPTKLGNVVVSNYTASNMHIQLAFELLDESARPINPPVGVLLLSGRGVAHKRTLENLRVHDSSLENLGQEALPCA